MYKILAKQGLVLNRYVIHSTGLSLIIMDCALYPALTVRKTIPFGTENQRSVNAR
jgi:ABC-type Fe3+/spermidine/putrescine transport system ATPase subunit